MDEQGQELPVVELQLHGGDPLQLAAELTMANKRVAELEVAREIDQKVIARLGDACDRTCDVLALARRWAAAWKRAAKQEHRAVEALARVLPDWHRNPDGDWVDLNTEEAMKWARAEAGAKAGSE